MPAHQPATPPAAAAPWRLRALAGLLRSLGGVLVPAALVAATLFGDSESVASVLLVAVLLAFLIGGLLARF